MTTTYTARCIFPATSPPLEQGTITVAGDRIESVDPHGVRTPDVDFGDTAIIPGLVNAHIHLDLTGAKGLIPPTDPDHFTDWLMSVIEYRKSRTPEQVQADIGVGLAECLNTGTTLLGDITADGANWHSVSESDVRGVIFREMIGLIPERTKQVQEEIANWADAKVDTSTCRKGFSPHAPYSARTDLIVVAGQLARLNTPKSPTAIHLAESSAEIDLLHHHRGPFVQFLKALGVWNDSGLAKDLSMVMNVGDYRQPKLFIHGNYLNANARIPRQSTIVYCPRTHAAFKHPRHPFAEFLARGVNVALGTDSLASNPDLDLFEEARYVYHNRKDVSGETVLKMATINGAKALGFDSECGSLEPGKSADFVVMPLTEDDGDPHTLLFNSQAVERRTLFRGEWRE